MTPLKRAPCLKVTHLESLRNFTDVCLVVSLLHTVLCVVILRGHELVPTMQSSVKIALATLTEAISSLVFNKTLSNLET